MDGHRRETVFGLRSAWRARGPGIDQLTFHDLRGTTVRRFAIASCTESEIAAIADHSLKEVSEILDRHFLSRDNVVGENAIGKLEARTRLGKRQIDGSAG
jgi:hypothetical protein